jgi:hypothetical protein
LEFERSDVKLTCYVDFDMGDSNKKLSLIAYVFTLCECAISWKFILQATIVLSTIETEYIIVIIVIEGIKEMILA